MYMLLYFFYIILHRNGFTHFVNLKDPSLKAKQKFEFEIAYNPEFLSCGNFKGNCDVTNDCYSTGFLILEGCPASNISRTKGDTVLACYVCSIVLDGYL